MSFDISVYKEFLFDVSECSWNDMIFGQSLIATQGKYFRRYK